MAVRHRRRVKAQQSLAAIENTFPEIPRGTIKLKTPPRAIEEDRDIQLPLEDGSVEDPAPATPGLQPSSGNENPGTPFLRRSRPLCERCAKSPEDLD